MTRRITATAILACGLAAWTTIGRAAVTPEDQAAINEALRGRAYEKAIGLIDAALARADAADREYLLFRRGLGLLFGGRHADAVEAFDAQLKAHPEGPWAAKARFRKADAFVALKQFESAEAIYADATRHLLGDERRAKLVQVYLDFAAEAFEPADKLVPPDYTKARTFYEKALEMEPGDALQDTILYRRALCNQKLNQHALAAGQYDAYLVRFDPDFRALRKMRNSGLPLPPPAPQTGAHRIEARLGLAECRLAEGNALEARRAVQDLLELRSKKEVPAESRVWIAAGYLLARSYGMPEPQSAEALTMGVQALESLIRQYPASKEAVQAAHDIGRGYARQGRYDEAIAAYRALIDRRQIRPGDSGAGSDESARDEVRKLAEELSQDALFSVGQLLYAQKKYADAIGAWNQYVAKYPTGPQWSASQQAIITAEYQIGADALADERFDDARTAWNAFLQQHPLDGRAAGILYQFGTMARREQEKREKAGQSPDWNEPIGHWRKLVNKFPNTEESGQAQYQIGQILEEKTGDLEGAIEAYTKLTWSSHAAAAKARVDDMRAVKLRLLTERSYRTDEPARVRVDARNIDALTVRLFRVDMEDYFRKSQSLRGVERLDLLLIDPDKTLEVPVAGYARYKPITQEIDIPFDGPGVWAVNVSNEKSTTRDAAGAAMPKVESTTLLVRSDIDVIVKTSRRQVLVFAQDMTAAAPAKDVRILVADGAKVWQEGRTGDDGVWIGKGDDLRKMGRLLVFAARDGHVAGNELSMAGLGFSTGLRPKGYLTTDQPAYRPGYAVNIRGVLREVKDGAYVVPAQPEDARLRWKLDVIDPKGRLLRTEDIALGEYGSFATQFRVAEDAPAGAYKLIARRVDGPTFNGQFEVQEYQLAKAYLTWDFDQPVVMRGDAIKGRLVAKYHYGEPAADKTVEYQMNLPTGDVIKRSGITDREGKIAFEFETSLLPEEAVAAFQANQADLGISAGGSVYVAVRAFRATVKTPRPLYLSEEPVEVAVETRDLKGEPARQTMTLTALRRTESRGQWGETKVESTEVETDGKSGVARASFKLTQGGLYVLRAEGKDRFGHTVTAESTVEVSDAEDATRIRLFSDRQNYKVGDTIALDVHSRLDALRKDRTETGSPGVGAAAARPILAFITQEGEEVIHFKTMRLEPGHNRFDLAVQHGHFPNFAVGVAVMAGNKFHAASRAFSVERELKVTITPDKKQYRPRDEMKVEIVVTDQQGRPVEAELGVVMIDDAVRRQFGDETPKIGEFFAEGAHRNAEMRTETSCAFRYEGQTRKMVTEVLAEAERLREESDLLASRAEAGASGAAGEALAAGRRDLPRNGRGSLFSGGGDANAPASSPVPMPAGRPSSSQLRALTSGGQSAFGIAQQLEDVAGSDLLRANVERQQILYLDAEMQPAEKSAMLRMDAGKRLRSQFDELNRQIAMQAGGQFVPANAPAVLEEAWKSVLAGAPPRTYFPEVAYWNPSVVTDADGRATVTIIVPDTSTTWRLVARGATKETLVGQAEAEAVSRHDFFVEVVAPGSILEGDQFTPAARVHCLTPYEGKIDVSFGLMPARPGADAPAGQTRTIEVSGTAVHDVAFEPVILSTPGEYTFDVTASTQADVPDAKRRLTDAGSAPLAVRPWGMRRETHLAGVGRDSEFVEIALPADRDAEYEDMRLDIAVGPGMQRWLVEEALETGPRWGRIEASYRGWQVAPPRAHADAASSLLGCLYAVDYLRSRGGADAAGDLRQLGDRAASLAAQLLSAQNDDGGWPWCGKAGPSDPWSSAQIAWALGKARADGHPISDSGLGKLAAYLKKAFADAAVAQTELKAVTLHGLSWLEAPDFGHANRLHRNRESLSTAGLAHLALTFARLERPSLAQEVLGILERKTRDVRLGLKACRVVSTEGNSAWMTGELEVTAMALLAQVFVDPRAGSVEPMVNYLAGKARADGWRPHKARGAVLAALCRYYGRAEDERANYTIVVNVNGREVRRLASGESDTTRIELAAADLAPGAQRVDFTFAGRGEYAYAVTLSGFRKGFPERRVRGNTALWCDNRWVSPPPPEYKGRPVQVGFGAAQRYDWFRNEVRHLPVGAVATVGLNVYRNARFNNDPDRRDYVIVQETIPAGFRLLTDSISGIGRTWDYSGNVLTLYCGNDQDLGSLTYRMVATTPGDYRLAPTIVRSLYDPDLVNVNESERRIVVLPRDAKNPDEYRLTPDELYHLARMNFDDGQLQAAADYLVRLLDGDWVLNDTPYRESVRMLLAAALERDDAPAIVNYFEIIKEKYADLVVPFEQILRVADAYAKTKQHERAYLVRRAIADAAFVRDSGVGGTLQAENRFLAGVDFMERLWCEYPDTPQVESIYFALSQTLYAKARDAGGLRPRTGEGRVTRSEVIRETIQILERFLALYPESPVADEASYSLANAYLEMNEFEIVLARSAQMIELFPKSKWLDRFRYIRALALFHLGKFDDARALAELVAESRYKDESGVERPSPNRDLALYIVGQIYHARRMTDKAIEYYKKVRQQFSDAEEAVSWFEHKYVEVPEVTVFHPDAGGFRESREWASHLRTRPQLMVRASEPGPGAPAAGDHRPEGTNGTNGDVEPSGHASADDAATDQAAPTPPPGAARLYRQPFVTLDYRNVRTAVIQVYRVDLMKLALMEKNLTRITRVNLAGIKPIVEKTLSLADGPDYLDRSVRVDLDLPKSPRATADRADPTGGAAPAPADAAPKDCSGAYLVICRGDDLYASGLVLVTPLAVEVQEDLVAQRTRVNVVDAITRDGMKSVHVKVIGTNMATFVSGETDLRGVCIADAVNGPPTAIARDASGHFAFHRSEGAVLAMAEQRGQVQARQADKKPGAKVDYNWNLNADNDAIQLGNRLIIEGLYKQQTKGVQAQKAQ